MIAAFLNSSGVMWTTTPEWILRFHILRRGADEAWDVPSNSLRGFYCSCVELSAGYPAPQKRKKEYITQGS